MATGISASSAPEQHPADSRQIKLHKYVEQELKYHTPLQCKQHPHAVFLIESMQIAWPTLAAAFNCGVRWDAVGLRAQRV